MKIVFSLKRNIKGKSKKDQRANKEIGSKGLESLGVEEVAQKRQGHHRKK